MMIRYAKNYATDLLKDKTTIRNIIETTGHKTRLTEDNIIVLEPRKDRCVCKTFVDDANELNTTLYGLAAIDEQFPTSKYLDSLYVELVVGVLSNTAAINVDPKDRERVATIFKELSMIDTGIEDSEYLIPIPRIRVTEDSFIVPVVGTNDGLDCLVNTYLPIEIEHIKTVNNYSLIEMKFSKERDRVDVRWLINRMNEVNYGRTRHTKIELDPTELYFSTTLFVQRVIGVSLIQEQFKDVTNEEIFEVILNLI